MKKKLWLLKNVHILKLGRIMPCQNPVAFLKAFQTHLTPRSTKTSGFIPFVSDASLYDQTQTQTSEYIT